MYLPSGDRRMVITPQLALRVAILGGAALVMFAVIFFRLWYLQVLSGDRYLAEAKNNRVRDIKVEAPRGKIVDRNGRVLVDNRTGLAIELSPEKLPHRRAERRRLYRRLGRALGMSPKLIARRVRRQLKALPFSTATVKQDVPLTTVSYVLEHQDRLPGVTAQRQFLRRYPWHSVGGQLFGTVGEVTAK